MNETEKAVRDAYVEALRSALPPPPEGEVTGWDDEMSKKPVRAVADALGIDWSEVES